MEKITQSGMQKIPLFSLLPESRSRGSVYFASTIINVGLLVLFVIFSWNAWRVNVETKEQEQVSLIIPVKLANTPRPLPRPHITPPPPVLVRNIPPRIVLPPREKAENAPNIVKLKADQPNTTALPSYKPADVARPPQPKVGLFQEHRPTAVANNQGRPTLRTGGFGDPVGVRTNPNSNNNQMAAYGSFQNSVGMESGAGQARKGSVHGVAFGSGYANGKPGGTGHGKVRTVGFGNNVIGGVARAQQGTFQQSAFHNNVMAQNAAPQVARAKTDYQQVQILFHPKPEYTQEAKQMHIQGEVVLEVRFAADGNVQVLRIVHGLGHGLDEQATRAAEQTKFRPAMKDGRPIDITTYYRINFQLA